MCLCGSSRGCFVADSEVAIAHGNSRLLCLNTAQYRVSITAPVDRTGTFHDWFVMREPTDTRYGRRLDTIEQYDSAIVESDRQCRRERDRLRCLDCCAINESLYNHHLVACPCGLRYRDDAIGDEGNGATLYISRRLSSAQSDPAALPTPTEYAYEGVGGREVRRLDRVVFFLCSGPIVCRSFIQSFIHMSFVCSCTEGACH